MGTETVYVPDANGCFHKVKVHCGSVERPKRYGIHIGFDATIGQLPDCPTNHCTELARAGYTTSSINASASSMTLQQMAALNNGQGTHTPTEAETIADTAHKLNVYKDITELEYKPEKGSDAWKAPTSKDFKKAYDKKDATGFEFSGFVHKLFHDDFNDKLGVDSKGEHVVLTQPMTKEEVDRYAEDKYVLQALSRGDLGRAQSLYDAIAEARADALDAAKPKPAPAPPAAPAPTQTNPQDEEIRQLKEYIGVLNKQIANGNNQPSSNPVLTHINLQDLTQQQKLGILQVELKEMEIKGLLTHSDVNKYGDGIDGELRKKRADGKSGATQGAIDDYLAHYDSGAPKPGSIDELLKRVTQTYQARVHDMPVQSNQITGELDATTLMYLNKDKEDLAKSIKVTDTLIPKDISSPLPTPRSSRADTDPLGFSKPSTRV